MAGRRSFATFWDGRPPGPYELLSFRSFIEAGAQHTIYSFNPKMFRDLSVNVVDARQIIRKNHSLLDIVGKAPWALVSDAFRYELLLREKVTWVDADFVLLNEQLFPPFEYLFGLEDPLTINNAVLALPSDSPLLQELSLAASKVLARGGSWGAAGPQLLTQKVVALGLWRWARPPSLFYPLLYNECWRLFDENSLELVRRKVELSAGIHLWNEILRGSEADTRHLLPHPKSFLGGLVEKFDLERNFIANSPVNVKEVRMMKVHQNSLRFSSRILVYRILGQLLRHSSDPVRRAFFATKKSLRI